MPHQVVLGDVASFVRGITFKPEDVIHPETPGSVWCLRTKNVQSELNLGDVWAVPAQFVKSSDRYLQPGDILVSSANSWNLVGKCCWVPELPRRSTFGGFVSVLRATSPAMEPRYLFHWFSSPRVQATLRSFGQQTTNISNLNVGRTLALPLALPSRAEQQRVAALLDKAHALRAKRRAVLESAGELPQAILIEMFGDPSSNPRRLVQMPLGELIDLGPQNGLYKPAENYGAGVPIVRIDAFYDGVITGLESLKRVSVSDAECEKYRLGAGDILITRVNSREYLGKSGLVPVLSEPTVFESNMMRLSVRCDLALPEYVVAVLQTSFVKRQILQSAKDAINQASINQADVRKLILPLPPLAEQERFKRSLAAVNRLVNLHTASRNQSDALFASLQHRAFNGTLWPNVETAAAP